MAKILTQTEIEREIITAEMDNRGIDLRNKIIQEVNLSDMEIKTPISFEGAKILGGAYFKKTVFYGDVIFRAAILNRVVYLGEATVKGNLNCQEIRVREGLNLIGATIGKNFILERAKIQGFLGMNETRIEGFANLKKINILNLESPTGVIAGDIYLHRARIKGTVDLTDSLIEGMLDLREIAIGGILNLTQVQIKDFFLLKNGIIKGEVKLTGLKYAEKII